LRLLNTTEKKVNGWAGFKEKHLNRVLSIALAVFSLPPSLFLNFTNGLDDSWKRALNLAVEKHLVFGRDFIFTYGPLGLLVTRNTHFTGNISLLLGDIVLGVGFYYVILKLLECDRRWLIMLVISIFLFKGFFYTEGLFLAFAAFTLFNFKNSFRSRFELVYMAISGALLFFIKINYGFISVGLLLAVSLFLLVKNRRAFILLTSVYWVVIAAGCYVFNVDPVSYVKNGLQIISYYDEAVSLKMDPLDLSFVSAVGLMAIFGWVLFGYVSQIVKERKFSASRLAPVILLTLTSYLMYRNGFTRGDAGHNAVLFRFFPLFITLALYALNYGREEYAKTIVSVVILISCINIVTLELHDKKKPFTYNATYFTPINYIKGLFDQARDTVMEDEKIINDKGRLVGNSTIDIFPHEIGALLQNNMNYFPRPIPQSYSVYSPLLDSINAAHFYGVARPAMIMMRNESIDNRYSFWDESLTKAAIRLNYEYVDYVAFNKLTLQYGTPTIVNYLLLKEKAQSHRKPQFRRISGQVAQLEETVPLHFPDSVAVYMTVAMDYTPAGKLRRVFYQPASLSMTLFPDISVSLDYQIKKPIIAGPVLINKYMEGNFELKNFMTGDLKKNHNITGFALHGDATYIKNKITVTFFQLENY
jgi:hypothetical protein